MLLIIRDSGDNAPIGIVASVECLIGFLAVSIATYRPLYRHFAMSASSPRATPNGYRIPMKDSYSAHVSADNRFFPNGSSNDSSRGITTTDEVELVHHVNRGGVWIRVDDEGSN